MTITPEQIMGAEALLGLAWTDRERAQMIGNLDGQIGSAVERRKLRLPNDVPPAQRFDPRLAGFRMPAPGVSVKVAPVAAPLPATDEDIAFAPLTHLSHWIATGGCPRPG